MSGEFRRSSGLIGRFSPKGRRGAVRSRPGAGSPVDGRQAGCAGRRCERRGAVAGQLTEKTAVVALFRLAWISLFAVGEVRGGLQTKLKGRFVGTGAPRMCEVCRRRRNGLNGHRQHKQQTKQPVTRHPDLFRSGSIKRRLNWANIPVPRQCYPTSPMEQVVLRRRRLLGTL